jgi:hypothetical protein
MTPSLSKTRKVAEMSSVTLFEADWYHGIIDSTMDSLPANASPDAVAIARGIMTAACIFSQAIDHLTGYGGDEPPLLDAIRNVGYAIQGVGEIMEEAKRCD